MRERVVADEWVEEDGKLLISEPDRVLATNSRKVKGFCELASRHRTQPVVDSTNPGRSRCSPGRRHFQPCSGQFHSRGTNSIIAGTSALSLS